MLETILQLLITGVALGFVYALVGVEYTLVWQSSGLLNVAHNMLITTAAFVFGGTFVVGLGWPIWLSILCTLLVMFVLGCLISATIFNPLRNMPLTMYSIVGTQIFAKVISEALRLIYGPYSFTIPGFLTGVIKIGDFVFAKAYGYIIVVAILLIIALQMFLKLTKPGKAMRCVAQNKTAAAIMGIDIDRSINITTGLSCVICGIIGVLTIPLFTISLTMSNMIGLKGWAAGIVGGFGYIPGTILGGLLIGVVESLAILVIPTVYKDIVAFVFLIVVLLIRPGGFKSPSVTMYRLYNRYTGEHFYTSDVSERDRLVSVGWSYEGVGWVAPVSGDPVYRLYNGHVRGGDHHYTTSASERDSLVRAGWSYEGVGWRSGGSVPVYRQYNPYARTGTHNYTADGSENDRLVSVGWRAEGVGWYAVSAK